MRRGSALKGLKSMFSHAEHNIKAFFGWREHDEQAEQEASAVTVQATEEDVKKPKKMMTGVMTAKAAVSLRSCAGAGAGRAPQMPTRKSPSHGLSARGATGSRTTQHLLLRSLEGAGAASKSSCLSRNVVRRPSVGTPNVYANRGLRSRGSASFVRTLTPRSVWSAVTRRLKGLRHCCQSKSPPRTPPTIMGSRAFARGDSARARR